MIKYKMHKPTNVADCGFAGITGDNLILEKEFFIEDLIDSSMRFTFHLRFADGSVNSVIPDGAEILENGTKIIWKIRKNDIFMHGNFELQIEGRNDEEKIFQTEIIKLYADESIPIEDKEYDNPNSETLAIRDEVYEILQAVNEQEEKIAENAKLITESDLTAKQDKLIFDNKPTKNSENSLTSGAVYTALEGKPDNDDVYYYWEADAEFLNKADAASTYAAKTELNAKFDTSNISTGSGTLTPTSETDIIKSAEYEYYKIGKQVTLIGKIVFNAGNITPAGYIALSGLPNAIKTNTMSSGIRMIAQTAYRTNFAVRLQGTWVSLQHSTTAFSVLQDEVLVFSITYLTT